MLPCDSCSITARMIRVRSPSARALASAPSSQALPNWLRTAAGQTRVVVGSYDGKLHCVDAATGQALWTYETGNYINGAPAIVQGRIIFCGCDALLHVIDGDGQKVGETDAGAYIAGSVITS